MFPKNILLLGTTFLFGLFIKIFLKKEGPIILRDKYIKGKYYEIW